MNELIKLVICGHVDHGKSTLIGRLLLDTKSLTDEKVLELENISSQNKKEVDLAFLTDQFEEERKENKTIDTTEIYFKTKKRRYCLIDTPGHVEFIKNMMTGATHADAGILVIDVEEGIKEQTMRHLVFLGSVGIKKIIVCVNKMDLVAFDCKRFRDIEKNIREFLARLKIKPLYILPVSAKKGANILKKEKVLAWFLGPSLIKALDALALKIHEGRRPLRLPIQDVYREEDATIFVGQIESGGLKTNQKVVLFPGRKVTQVSSIKIFEKKRKAAFAGENIGFTLKDPRAVARGSVVCQKENAPAECDHFTGSVFWLSFEPLIKSKKMILRSVTQEVGCQCVCIEARIDSSVFKILEHDAEYLKENELGKVSFKTERPVVLEPFDFIRPMGRFILECQGVVCGVGIIGGQSLSL
jgi:small GTP-binding protein